MQCIVRPAAAADIDEAFLWYENQRPGLGHDFLAAADTLINAIAEHPLRSQSSAETPGERFCVVFPMRCTFASTTRLSSWSHACMAVATRGAGRDARDG